MKLKENTDLKMVNEDRQEYWQDALRLFENALKDNYLEDIMQLLLTSDERESLLVRVQIVRALLSGEINQRELKEKLGTGIATITRGSNSLKLISPDFRQWLDEQFKP